MISRLIGGGMSSRCVRARARAATRPGFVAAIVERRSGSPRPPPSRTGRQGRPGVGNGLLQIGGNAGSCGSTLGGVLLRRSDPGWCWAGSASSFVVLTAIIATVRGGWRRPSRARRDGTVGSEGFVFIARDHVLRTNCCVVACRIGSRSWPTFRCGAVRWVERLRAEIGAFGAGSVLGRSPAGSCASATTRALILGTIVMGATTAASRLAWSRRARALVLYSAADAAMIMIAKRGSSSAGRRRGSRGGRRVEGDDRSRCRSARSWRARRRGASRGPCSDRRRVGLGRAAVLDLDYQSLERASSGEARDRHATQARGLSSTQRSKWTSSSRSRRR